MVNAYRISAVTLLIKNMKRSCNFYSQIPGFKLIYGGSSNDFFTTYKIGNDPLSPYLNLDLNKEFYSYNSNNRTSHFGRIIFHTDDVDELYLYFKNNKEISNIIRLETEPKNASWGERYFHLREPDGYQLSFAEPLK